jgi:predicted RNA binding protein YcfA (HicA-like mRNA interferase family)
MSKLPRISERDCLKALQRVGFYLKRRESSHMILRRDQPFAQLVVPDHDELDRGTLRSIIRHAGLSVDEFVRHLK